MKLNHGKCYRMISDQKLKIAGANIGETQIWERRE